MTTRAEQEKKAFQDAKDKGQLLALAEMRSRNARDVQQSAQGKVREWATRLAKDPSLAGYDLDAYLADIRASEEAFLNFAEASVLAARLRSEERTTLMDYAENQGRSPES